MGEKSLGGDSEGVEGRRQAGGGMLVLDTSYTLEMVKERGLESTILCRDLDGFFDHVWSVHPFATLLTSQTWAPRYGRPVWREFSDRHTVVEGKVGRFAALARVFPLNFLIAQAGLFFSLWRLIRSRNIRVVRVGDPLYLGLFGWALARASGVPLAMRVNANNAKVRSSVGGALFPRLFRSARVEEAVERFVMKRTDLVAALNPDNLEFALASGAREEFTTLFRLGNLIAPEHLSDPEQRKKDDPIFAELGVVRDRYLLSIGRLEAIKFPEDVLRVHHHVRQAGHDVKMVFAGDGSCRESLGELARELGTLEHVVFAGNQSQSQLARLIPNAAAIVSPFMGRALTEAGFGAAPVVAYDADWQSEAIETGVTGELVPFRDWQAMARSLLKLLEDRSYARAMGRGLRQRIQAMMDPETLNEHEREQYRRLFARYERSVS